MKHPESAEVLEEILHRVEPRDEGRPAAQPEVARVGRKLGKQRRGHLASFVPSEACESSSCRQTLMHGSHAIANGLAEFEE